MRSFDDCDNCIRYQRHIKLATEARKLLYRLDKERDWADDEIVLSIDMQVIMVPMLPGLKLAMFCKHVVLFNEIFAPVGGKNHGITHAVLWHGRIAGRPVGRIALPMHVHDFIDISTWSFSRKVCRIKAKNEGYQGNNLIYWKDSYQQDMLKVSHFLQKKYQKKNV